MSSHSIKDSVLPGVDSHLFIPSTALLAKAKSGDKSQQDGSNKEDGVVGESVATRTGEDEGQGADQWAEIIAHHPKPL